jgi:hypothetical protein
MTRPALIAWRTYLAPLATLRAARIGVPIVLFLIAAVAALRFSGLIKPDTLRDLQHFVILPGIPLFAALLGEMALRDGITQRTLLYPLLGPVPRGTLATVRTAATAALLAVASIALLIVLRLIAGGPWTNIMRELVAVVLAAFAYTSLAGIVHLVSPRGLILSLALYGIFDYPLGRLPISLRVLAPSHHVRTLADISDPFSIPISVHVAAASPAGSAVVLVIIVLVALVAGAVIFTNKKLAELC